MDENEELLRLIDKLGDDLGNIIKLTELIFNTVRDKFSINSSTLGIWRFYITLPRIEEAYTNFHTNIFKELNNKNKMAI